MTDTLPQRMREIAAALDPEPSVVDQNAATLLRAAADRIAALETLLREAVDALPDHEADDIGEHGECYIKDRLNAPWWVHAPDCIIARITAALGADRE